MKSEKKEFIALRIANAQKTLKEVEDILIVNSLWNTAINRLYYACFYAVTALLHNYDLDTKTHSGVQHVLGLHFVKPGIINKELGKFYTRIFGMRQNADYEAEVEYDRNDVLELLEPAHSLISTIEKILSETN